MFRQICFAALAALPASRPAAAQAPAPLKVVNSWVGNSFEGAGPNGEGRWMQNMIDEIEVTPDGTVITASVWDEAGRCTALYRDGQPNTKLLQQKGNHKAWGWGTAGTAVAATGHWIFLVNTEGELMRFRWSPSDTNSAVQEG
jgi:hypothetical protein